MEGVIAEINGAILNLIAILACGFPDKSIPFFIRLILNEKSVVGSCPLVCAPGLHTN